MRRPFCCFTTVSLWSLACTLWCVILPLRSNSSGNSDCISFVHLPIALSVLLFTKFIEIHNLPFSLVLSSIVNSSANLCRLWTVLLPVSLPFGYNCRPLPIRRVCIPVNLRVSYYSPHTFPLVVVVG